MPPCIIPDGLCCDGGGACSCVVVVVVVVALEGLFDAQELKIMLETVSEMIEIDFFMRN